MFGGHPISSVKTRGSGWTFCDPDLSSHRLVWNQQKNWTLALELLLFNKSALLHCQWQSNAGKRKESWFYRSQFPFELNQNWSEVKSNLWIEFKCIDEWMRFLWYEVVTKWQIWSFFKSWIVPKSFIFSQKLVSLFLFFKGLFNDKTYPMINYTPSSSAFAPNQD